MKSYFIEDLHNSVGLTAEGEFAVAKSERKLTREGKPYMDLTLRDRTGEVTAKVWADHLAEVKEHAVGDVVRVDFEVREYKGNIELTVRSLTTITEFDSVDYIPVIAGLDAEQLKTLLAKRIDSVRDFQLRKLLDAFFEDPDFYKAYTESPAGMYVHHDYRHGLLQHSLEMLTIIDGFTQIYPDLNRDLITTATLLHDIGKVTELNVTPTGLTEYSREGQFLGHIALGVVMIEKRLPEDFPSHIREQLLHIVVSHQGKRETGSPVAPATREAVAVYHADMASTFLNIAEQERKKGLKKKDQQEFSDYNKYLGNAIYLGD